MQGNYCSEEHQKQIVVLISLVKWILGVVITIFWGTVSLLVSLFDASGRASDFCMRIWSRWCLDIVGIDLEIHGRENIASDTAYVVVSNHQGTIDVFILAV